MNRNLLLALAFLAVLSRGNPAVAQSNWEFTGVEEDWELVLLEPAAAQDSPQISTWMSPTDSLEHEHFAADFNHAQRPDFSSGGFQAKAMRGDVLVADRVSENGDNFIYESETVTWTQRMEISDGSLEFSVINGRSRSWGSFGGSSSRVRFASSPVSNLNQYSLNKSVEWAGVGFGANRVQSLVLKRVRYFIDGNLFATVEVNQEVN